ncbi:Peptide hydrolase [Fusarium keratoplasticum]|uniref:Peptide hydrolase n=1 Tax=Fusarium keratoplasticum TaxID=1328300 RepID=A0ACC0QCL1_9HYPO|nr:Peptide hydrolase [Fusarium keratoplasticum]KAI8650421.1 Peptide hydrolase [Fusarium keratoplasticum]KAI8651245.1 Peptide hydrolase [Fusarium keratoplasticum]
MHLSLALAALVGLSSAVAVPRPAPQLYKIQLAPDDIRTVTEEEKWALRAEHKHFIDITDLDEEPPISLQVLAGFPTAVSQQTAVNALLPKLSQTRLRDFLTTFSNFQNRYYTASYGQQSAEWLLGQVQAIISASGATNVNVKTFTHSWRQPSIIATIPGKSAKTIVVGAHQDSVNLSNRASGRAPGADDDGSGSATILEAFRVLLTDSRVASNQAENTIEFHWYAGEEAGLLGSGAIFQQYLRESRDVKAMLNQDMTGYVKPGSRQVIGVITDNVDASLTAFTKKIITAYSTLPAVDTKCGYGCSDHASATRVGYPSAFVFESTFDDSSPYIHSAQDTISTVNFGHVAEFVKVVIGFTYELGFASL